MKAKERSGEIQMIIYNKIIKLILIFSIFIGNNLFSAQPGDLATSINFSPFHSFVTHAEKNYTTDPSERRSLEEKFGIRLEFYRHPFMGKYEAHRFGIRASYFEADNSYWPIPPYSREEAFKVTYKMLEIQANNQFLLVRGAYIHFLLELAGGVALLYSSRDRDSPAPIFPAVPLPNDAAFRVNVECGTKLMFPIRKNVGIQIGTSYRIQPFRKAPNFPFYSNVIFNIGVVLSNK